MIKIFEPQNIDFIAEWWIMKATGFFKTVIKISIHKECLYHPLPAMTPGQPPCGISEK